MSQKNEKSNPRIFPRLILYFVGLLLGVELLLRLFLQSPGVYRIDREYGRRLRPSAEWIVSTEGYSRSRTNSFGLVDDEILPVKPRLRTLLLGDSFAMGVQVSQSERFARLVEERIVGHECINAGQSGWTAVPGLLFARQMIEKWQPDALVAQVSDGAWDLLARTDMAHLSRIDSGGFEIQPPRFSGRFLWRMGIRLASYSAIGNLVHARLKALLRNQLARYRQKFSGATSRLDSTSERIDSEALAKIDWVFRTYAELGRPVIVLYIPRLIYVDGPCRPRIPRSREAYTKLAHKHGLRLVEPTQRLCAAFERTGQPLHGFHNWLIGEGHLNKRGHIVVADALTEALLELVP